jgi:hypothetical protein
LGNPNHWGDYLILHKLCKIPSLHNEEDSMVISPWHELAVVNISIEVGLGDVPGTDRMSR